MILKLLELKINFKRSIEIISFEHVSVFYGQMGAGKSSIARLIDFCLGGDIVLSPALQNEFNSAVLKCNINGSMVALERVRNNNLITANFSYEEVAPILWTVFSVF